MYLKNNVLMVLNLYIYLERKGINYEKQLKRQAGFTTI